MTSILVAVVAFVVAIVSYEASRRSLKKREEAKERLQIALGAAEIEREQPQPHFYEKSAELWEAFRFLQTFDNNICGASFYACLTWISGCVALIALVYPFLPQ